MCGVRVCARSTGEGWRCVYTYYYFFITPRCHDDRLIFSHVCCHASPTGDDISCFRVFFISFIYFAMPGHVTLIFVISSLRFLSCCFYAAAFAIFDMLPPPSFLLRLPPFLCFHCIGCWLLLLCGVSSAGTGGQWGVARCGGGVCKVCAAGRVQVVVCGVVWQCAVCVCVRACACNVKVCVWQCVRWGSTVWYNARQGQAGCVRGGGVGV